jgi:hypothetical protein
MEQNRNRNKHNYSDWTLILNCFKYSLQMKNIIIANNIIKNIRVI